MNSINNSASNLTLDRVDDNIPSRQFYDDDDDFSRILKQVNNVDRESVENFIELEEEEEEDGDTDLLEKKRTIEFIEGRERLNFLFHHPSKNSYINDSPIKIDIGGIDESSLHYHLADYKFIWRKIQVEGSTVKFDLHFIEFKILNLIHNIESTFPNKEERVNLSFTDGVVYLNNTFNEAIKIEDYKQDYSVSMVNMHKLELSSDYFNQMNGLNRYRVYYKKKYYIFEFDNGRLVDFIRDNDDGS